MLVGRVIVDDPMNYLASCTPPRTAFSRADGRLMCLLWRIAGPAHLGGRILIACAAPFGWRPPPPLTRAANCARGFSRQRAIPQAACGRTWPVSRQRSLLMEKNTSQEAERACHTRGHAARPQRQIENPLARRTCVRRNRRTEWTCSSEPSESPGEGEDRPRQPRL
jgi:hypothetical protein